VLFQQWIRIIENSTALADDEDNPSDSESISSRSSLNERIADNAARSNLLKASSSGGKSE